MCLLTLFHRATKQRIKLINYVKYIQLKLHVQRYRKNTSIQWKIVNDMKSTTKRGDPLVPQLLLSDKNLWRRGFDLIPRKYKICLKNISEKMKHKELVPSLPFGLLEHHAKKCLVQGAK